MPLIEKETLGIIKHPFFYMQKLINIVFQFFLKIMKSRSVALFEIGFDTFELPRILKHFIASDFLIPTLCYYGCDFVIISPMLMKFKTYVLTMILTRICVQKDITMI